MVDYNSPGIFEFKTNKIPQIDKSKKRFDLLALKKSPKKMKSDKKNVGIPGEQGLRTAEYTQKAMDFEDFQHTYKSAYLKNGESWHQKVHSKDLEMP